MFDWLSPDFLHHLFAVKQAIHIGSYTIVPTGGEYTIYYMNEVTNQLQMMGSENSIHEAVKTIHDIKINIR